MNAIPGFERAHLKTGQKFRNGGETLYNTHLTTNFIFPINVLSKLNHQKASSYEQAALERKFYLRRFGQENAECIDCGSGDLTAHPSGKDHKWRCRDCDRRFGLFSNTFFEGYSYSLRDVYELLQWFSECSDPTNRKTADDKTISNNVGVSKQRIHDVFTELRGVCMDFLVESFFFEKEVPLVNDPPTDELQQKFDEGNLPKKEQPCFYAGFKYPLFDEGSNEFQEMVKCDFAHPFIFETAKEGWNIGKNPKKYLIVILEGSLIPYLSGIGQKQNSGMSDQFMLLFLYNQKSDDMNLSSYPSLSSLSKIQKSGGIEEVIDKTRTGGKEEKRNDPNSTKYGRGYKSLAKIRERHSPPESSEKRKKDKFNLNVAYLIKDPLSFSRLDLEVLSGYLNNLSISARQSLSLERSLLVAKAKRAEEAVQSFFEENECLRIFYDRDEFIRERNQPKYLYQYLLKHNYPYENSEDYVDFLLNILIGYDSPLDFS